MTELKALPDGVITLSVKRMRTFGSVSGGTVNDGGQHVFTVELMVTENAWRKLHSALQQPLPKDASNPPTLLPGQSFRVIRFNEEDDNGGS